MCPQYAFVQSISLYFNSWNINVNIHTKKLQHIYFFKICWVIKSLLHYNFFSPEALS